MWKMKLSLCNPCQDKEVFIEISCKTWGFLIEVLSLNMRGLHKTPHNARTLKFSMQYLKTKYCRRNLAACC